MRQPVRTTRLLLAASLGVAACGDGTAPGESLPDVPFYAIRFAETDLGLWRYQGGAATRVSCTSRTSYAGM